MLLKGLYELSEFRAEEGSFSAKISFDPEHDIFKGHFPGQPVVPGVCLIHIVKDITNMLSDDKVRLQKGTNTKFLQLIDPQKNPEVSINGTYSLNDSVDMNITAFIAAEGTTFFKFKGIFS